MEHVLVPDPMALADSKLVGLVCVRGSGWFGILQSCQNPLFPIYNVRLRADLFGTVNRFQNMLRLRFRQAPMPNAAVDFNPRLCNG